MARLGKMEFKDSLAWLIWPFVHSLQLIGFRSRLLVNWDLLFYEHAVHMIVPCVWQAGTKD